jgi:arsenate reductase
MSTVIWHNPRCSKSRETLQLLRNHGVEPDIRLYLDNAPSTDDINLVLERTGMEPRQLMRRKEPEYRVLGLSNPSMSHDELVAAMQKNPRLIERPVVLHNGRAAVGRPPENILAIL